MKIQVLFLMCFLGILLSCNPKIIREKETKMHNSFKYQETKEVQSKKEDFGFHVCSIESKSKDFCIEIYQPVCGWFVESPIQCMNPYCRESFANECFACKDKRVIGYTNGSCKQ
ncbi:MAG: hypothetical protein ACK4UJ_00180 [Leptonema sp. (in: bacteria)]